MPPGELSKPCDAYVLPILKVAAKQVQVGSAPVIFMSFRVYLGKCRSRDFHPASSLCRDNSRLIGKDNWRDDPTARMSKQRTSRGLGVFMLEAKPYRVICALVLFAVMLVPAAARPTEWESKYKNQNDRLEVFEREVPGSPIKELKGVGEIDAPPRACWNVIRDYNGYAAFMPYVKKSEILKVHGATTYLYSVIDPNLPFISVRDYTIKIDDVSEPASNRYGTRWTTANDDGPTKEPAMIRIERNVGSWEFTPLDNGRRTLATYVLHTDPGGQLPSWASAWANLRAIPGVFSALRRTVGEAKYRDDSEVPAR